MKTDIKARMSSSPLHLPPAPESGKIMIHLYIIFVFLYLWKYVFGFVSKILFFKVLSNVYTIYFMTRFHHFTNDKASL